MFQVCVCKIRSHDFSYRKNENKIIQIFIIILLIKNKLNKYNKFYIDIIFNFTKIKLKIIESRLSLICFSWQPIH